MKCSVRWFDGCSGKPPSEGLLIDTSISSIHFKAFDLLLRSIQVTHGFALSGLTAALMAQGKNEEAAEMDRQFQEAWKLAEMDLKGSEIDPEKRQDVALTIDATSPKELVYLAAAFCMR